MCAVYLLIYYVPVWPFALKVILCLFRVNWCLIEYSDDQSVCKKQYSCRHVDYSSTGTDSSSTAETLGATSTVKTCLFNPRCLHNCLGKNGDSSRYNDG